MSIYRAFVVPLLMCGYEVWLLGLDDTERLKNPGPCGLHYMAKTGSSDCVSNAVSTLNDFSPQAASVVVRPCPPPTRNRTIEEEHTGVTLFDFEMGPWLHYWDRRDSSRTSVGFETAWLVREIGFCVGRTLPKVITHVRLPLGTLTKLTHPLAGTIYAKVAVDNLEDPVVRMVFVRLSIVSCPASSSGSAIKYH